jgi:transposase InsO family protein
MFQKEQFVIKALKKEISFKALCHEFQISRETGYTLLRRYKEEGLQGLNPRSRAPHQRPYKTSHTLEEQILTVRTQYPTWGARKIYSHLKKRGLHDIPARSTISDILKRHGYISEEESLKRQALCRFEREEPNELWQMDFKGKFHLANKEWCYPLTILDDCSRFSLCIKASPNEQCVSVKSRLTEVFEQYGLPKQFNVDNGSPWGNSKLLSHTQLTVWLMRMGIRVTHSRPRHPQTNGKLERFHRTFKKDVLHKAAITDFTHAQLLFDEWREIYNYQRPHQAINMQVPAERYKPSKRPIPLVLNPIEYSDDAQVRKVRGNGRISYKGHEYLAGEAFAGHQVEIKPNPLGEQFDIYFDQFKIYTYHLKN